jgi:hypothetical protein
LRIETNAQLAAVWKIHPSLHLGGRGKALVQLAMNFPRIGSSGGILRLELIEFFEHLDRDPNGVLLELEHRLRVVQ